MQQWNPRWILGFATCRSLESKSLLKATLPVFYYGNAAKRIWKLWVLFLRVLFPVRVHVLCSPIQVSALRFIGMHIGHTYKAHSSSPSSSSSSSLNMSSACVKFLSSAKKSSLLSSLSSFDPKPWIISFGKFISQYLSPLHLINSFFPARSSILSVLGDAITVGHLTISDSQGTHYYGNYQQDCIDLHIQVINDSFWFRILLWAIVFPVGLTPSYILSINIVLVTSAVIISVDNFKHSPHWPPLML